MSQCCLEELGHLWQQLILCNVRHPSIAFLDLVKVLWCAVVLDCQDDRDLFFVPDPISFTEMSGN